jgi:hypothetical protein
MQLSIKHLVLVLLIIPVSFSANCQEKKANEKNRFFFCWGWNRSSYTASDIHFKGSNYDFTLHNVAAKDRQSPIGIDPYFHLLKITIPQVNYVLGYYLKNNFSISFGVDHMKYVVVEGQTSSISGEISANSYSGSYQDQPIVLSPQFLEFEHTDGLNYVYFELSRHSQLSKAKKWGTISFTKGVSIGSLYPRSDITLMGQENYDKFNVTGYGGALKMGTRFELWNRIFITNEVKWGYLHMPKIPTSNNKGEYASQHFGFFQTNVILGFFLDFKKKGQANTN